MKSEQPPKTHEQRSTMTLTRDAELVERLRGKLSEYQTRIDKPIAPELNYREYFKHTILSTLLENGTADSDEVWKDLRTRFGKKVEPSFGIFVNTWGVIESYNIGDQSRLAFSTGLPKAKKE